MPLPSTRTRLSQATLKELLHYDPQHGIFSWNVTRSYKAREGDEAGSIRGTDGNVLITVNGKVWMANRLAWLYMTGELPPGRLIAINGERADLRWTNIALEKDHLSTHPVAVYERKRRFKEKMMFDRKLIPTRPGDFRKIYHDKRDPHDDRNREIYVAPVAPPAPPRRLPRDANGVILMQKPESGE